MFFIGGIQMGDASNISFMRRLEDEMESLFVLVTEEGVGEHVTLAFSRFGKAHDEDKFFLAFLTLILVCKHF